MSMLVICSLPGGLAVLQPVGMSMFPWQGGGRECGTHVMPPPGGVPVHGEGLPVSPHCQVSVAECLNLVMLRPCVDGIICKLPNYIFITFKTSYFSAQ